MTEREDDDVKTLITEILKRPKIQTQITQEKASTREQLIARLTSLFAMSFEMASKNGTKEGPLFDKNGSPYRRPSRTHLPVSSRILSTKNYD